MVNFSFNIATPHEARPSKSSEIFLLKNKIPELFTANYEFKFHNKTIFSNIDPFTQRFFTHLTNYSLSIIFDDMQRHLWTKCANYDRSKIISNLQLFHKDIFPVFLLYRNLIL